MKIDFYWLVRDLLTTTDSRFLSAISLLDTVKILNCLSIAISSTLLIAGHSAEAQIGSQPLKANNLQAEAITAAPKGLYDFCDRQPQACASPLPFEKPLPIQSFTPTRAQRILISKVNDQINQALIEAPETKASGAEEFWSMPLSLFEGTRIEGKPLADCEDFALEKRQALMEANIPVNSIFLAVGITRVGELHTVLVVATADGDLVLDNRAGPIWPAHQTEYIWLSRQTTTSIFDWSLVKQP